MKIIQVIPRFGLAGAETMCQNLACSLAKQKHEIIVVSLYDFHSALTEKLQNAGIRIIYLGKKLGLDFRMLKKLYEVFKTEKPDVVHTHMNSVKYAMPAASLVGVPVKIHTVHSLAEKEAPSSVTKCVYSFLFKHMGVVPVALTEKVQDSITKYYNLSSKSIPVVLNGIDFSCCIPKIEYERKEIFTFLHIGRFEPAKNHRGLIEAFRIFTERYADVRLQLIGDGALRSEMEEFVKQSGIKDKVFFEGIQNNVYPFLNLADCFILPSQYEGMPMTLIEAMGTALPIIATEVGGIPDMIENGTEGILIENSPQEIVKAMEVIYIDETLRKDLGQNALRRSQSMSANAMALAYLKVYDDVRIRNKR